MRPYFRAAYHPGGNDIVERNHRTIKAIAERGYISPMEAVFGIKCLLGLVSRGNQFLSTQFFVMIGGTQLSALL